MASQCSQGTAFLWPMAETYRARRRSVRDRSIAEKYPRGEASRAGSRIPRPRSLFWRGSLIRSMRAVTCLGSYNSECLDAEVGIRAQAPDSNISLRCPIRKRGFENSDKLCELSKATVSSYVEGCQKRTITYHGVGLREAEELMRLVSDAAVPSYTTLSAFYDLGSDQRSRNKRREHLFGSVDLPRVVSARTSWAVLLECTCVVSYCHHARIAAVHVGCENLVS